MSSNSPTPAEDYPPRLQDTVRRINDFIRDDLSAIPIDETKLRQTAVRQLAQSMPLDFTAEEFVHLTDALEEALELQFPTLNSQIPILRAWDGSLPPPAEISSSSAYISRMRHFKMTVLPTCESLTSVCDALEAFISSIKPYPFEIHTQMVFESTWNYIPGPAGLPLKNIEVLVHAYVMQEFGNGFVQSDLPQELWTRVRQFSPALRFYNCCLHCGLRKSGVPDWFVPDFDTSPPVFAGCCMPALDELMDQVNIKTCLHATVHKLMIMMSNAPDDRDFHQGYEPDFDPASEQDTDQDIAQNPDEAIEQEPDQEPEREPEQEPEQDSEQDSEEELEIIQQLEKCDRALFNLYQGFNFHELDGVNVEQSQIVKDIISKADECFAQVKATIAQTESFMVTVELLQLTTDNQYFEHFAAKASRFERAKLRHRMRQTVDQLKTERLKQMDWSLLRLNSEITNTITIPEQKWQEDDKMCAFDWVDIAPQETGIVVTECCKKPFHVDCLGTIFGERIFWQESVLCPCCRQDTSLESVGRLLDFKVRALNNL